MTRSAYAPVRPCLAVLAAALLASGVAEAQAPAAVPAVATKSPASAPAGTYKADPNHTSVVARVPHGGGMSFSIFRFGDTQADLHWDPANPARATLSAKVETASIATPVKGFAEELQGKDYLDSARFPSATFTSTAVRKTGPLSVEISGNFTFHGVTRPMVLKAEMVGAGRNREGMAALGFSATGRMKPAEFGLKLGPPQTEIELVIESEFARAS